VCVPLETEEMCLGRMQVMATACWVWMFWRAYNDGAVVLVGISTCASIHA
jgi:hypothetical protein